jgi:sugar lactone lactonase YvrE
MKKSLALLLLLSLPLSAKPQLELLWQTEGLRVPESVLVYQQHDESFLFVSEIDGEGNVADGKGGVALLNNDGSIRDQNWLRGLNAPKGLAQYQGKLYVADLTELVIIDIATVKVTAKIPAPDAVFLNDVTVDEQGTVYISDTRKNRIYKYSAGTLNIWLEDIVAANGLKSIGSDLYIAAADLLLKADKNDKLTLIAQGFSQRADGLEPINNGDFIVSCWAGIIYYVYADGRIEPILDTQQQKLNTADIGWDASTNTLYVPTFLGNSVAAYRLSF